MLNAKKENEVPCPHQALTEMEGTVLVTSGKSPGTCYAVGPALCDGLPSTVLTGVCRFDLGEQPGSLADCLAGHKVAIIIDSTCNGAAPGTVSIADLSAMVSQTSPLKLSSCHGSALAEELRLAQRFGTLPRRVILFGVEMDRSAWAGNPGPVLQEQMPRLVTKLSYLVTKVVETLKRHA